MPSAIGGGLQSLGSAMPSFLGGATGTLGNWASGAGNWLNPAGIPAPPTDSTYTTPPPNMPMDTYPVPTSLPSELPPTSVAPTSATPDTSGWANLSAPPAGTMSADDIARGLASSYVGAAGGAPAPAPGTGALNTALNTTGQQYGAALANDPSDPTSAPWYTQVLKSLFGTPGRGATTIGDLFNQIQRWQVSRTLSDPSAMASGASQLYRPMSKAMKRAIINPVTAAAQETGQINAPGLYAQSVATALGPYQYQMQMQALQDYIEALRASGEAYGTGPFGAGGPMYQGGYGSYANQGTSSD